MNKKEEEGEKEEEEEEEEDQDRHAEEFEMLKFLQRCCISSGPSFSVRNSL